MIYTNQIIRTVLYGVSRLAHPKRHTRLRHSLPIEWIPTNQDRAYIFIHVPKTGGHTVSHTLFGHPSKGHFTLSSYVNAYSPAVLDRAFTFAFVRNPWSRLYSAFNYLKQGGNNKDDAYFNDLVLRKFTTFDDFVRGWIDSSSIQKWIHFLPQTHFINADNKYKLSLDFIGKYESFTEDLLALSNILHIQAEHIPRYNATDTRKDYRHAYTSIGVDTVASVYADDITQLGYDFET